MLPGESSRPKDVYIASNAMIKHSLDKTAIMYFTGKLFSGIIKIKFQYSITAYKGKVLRNQSGVKTLEMVRETSRRVVNVLTDVWKQ